MAQQAQAQQALSQQTRPQQASTQAQAQTNAQHLSQLQQTWYQTIPLSEFMQVQPLSFEQNCLTVTAPLAPNINLHQTMFAGSIYTLMALTGWGMVWLQQQLNHVRGDIVLAGAKVRYLAPIESAPIAKVIWPDKDISALQRGERLRVQLTVELFCPSLDNDSDILCATFEGNYVSLPERDNG